MSKYIIFIKKYFSVFLGFLFGSLIVGHAVSNIMLGISIFISILFAFSNGKIRFNKNYLPLLIYIFWGILSLMWTTDADQTLHGIKKQISFLLIPVFFSQYSEFKIEDLVKIFRIFSICLLLYFFSGLINSLNLYLVDSDISHFFYHDLTLLFENNAIYISLFVSFTLLGMINLPYKKTKLDYLIILLLMVYLILLSSKNLIFTTFFIQILVIFIFNKDKKHKLLVLSGLFIMLLLFLLFIFFDSPLKERYIVESKSNYIEIFTKDDFRDYEFNGTTLRLFQIRSGIEMFMNNGIGLLGLGLDNAQYLLDQYGAYYNFYNGIFTFNFHNQYMQTFIEIGIIGGLILIYILVLGIKKSLKERNIMLFAFIVIMIFLFITESVFSRQKGILFFVFSYCVLMNLKKIKLNNVVNF